MCETMLSYCSALIVKIRVAGVEAGEGDQAGTTAGSGPSGDLQSQVRQVPSPDTRWFRHELTPTWITTATMLAGYRPPELTRPFRLAWFGCRAPFNPAVAAAVHSGAEVLAWDPDPTGIVKVRSLRDEAELPNFFVHEQPDMPSSAAGQFDIMVIDGLVDAVDGERRAQLVGAAASLLRPGGVLCITYRTVVGWGEFVPIVRFLRHAIDRTSRDVATSVADAMVLLDILRQREVGYLATRPVVRAWVDALLGSAVDDVIAEYVQRDLRPASHAQIAGAMASVGGSFIGSAFLDDGLPEGVPENLATIVREAPSNVLRESLTDLVLRRPSRADLFTLGGLADSARERTQHIKVLPLTAFGTDPRGVEQQLPWGQERPLDIDAATDQLESRCLTAGDLWAGASAKERQPMLREALRTGRLHPVQDGAPYLDPVAVTAAARLTDILDGTGTLKAHRHVVAPLVGSAVPAGLAMDSDHLRFLQGDR